MYPQDAEPEFGPMRTSQAAAAFRGRTGQRSGNVAGLAQRVLPAAGWLPGLRRWRGVLRVTAVLLPTLAAAAYYFAIASDRYVSEARFVIRSGTKPTGLGGINALLQFVGLSRSEDDVYAVRDFLTSRDAMHQLLERLPLTDIYGRPEADWLTRYPSVAFGGSDEDLYRYFERMLSVVVNSTTGLTTLRVQAFRAGDAYRVAESLLVLGEGLVNRLNTRVQEDAVRVAAGELAQAEKRRIDNQIAVTVFRTREMVLDPTKSSAIVVELIGKLSEQLAEVRAQIAETQAGAPGSPELPSLQQRAAALDRQIAIESARVANGSDRLAEKIGQYEGLMLEREFSIRALSQAVAALEAARTEARRQQLFLERVVEPGLPDKAMMPERWRMVLTVLGFNVIGWGIIWLIGAGLREHASNHAD